MMDRGRIGDADGDGGKGKGKYMIMCVCQSILSRQEEEE